MTLFVCGARANFLPVITISCVTITPRVSSIVRKVRSSVFLTHSCLTLLGVAMAVLVEIIGIFLVFIIIVASVIVIARIIIAAGLFFKTFLRMLSNFTFFYDATWILRIERSTFVLIDLPVLEGASIVV